MDFIKQTKYQLLIATSVMLALNSYFFIERKSTNAFPLIFDNIKIHYLIYLACASGIVWVWWKFLRNEQLTELIKKFLLTFLPTEIIFILGLFIIHNETQVHFLFYLSTGLYLIASALFFIESSNHFKKNESLSRKKLTHWFKKQGLISCFILFISLSTFGYFATNQIENYAGVDEPLWTLDRIPFFWKNVSEMDWKNTSISDKPGITVAIISGLGLLDNPVSYQYDQEKKIGNFILAKDIHTVNKDFRFPLAIFCLLSLFIFYIFIQKLSDKKTALLSIIFISTSPMLIGMSRLVNPDAILWVFVPLAILAYLIFLQKETRLWLYLSGILLGLAILTKYVANILYIFFFGLIFLEYLFKDKQADLSLYLKKTFTQFFSVVLISLVTFFVLFPETWVNLSKLFTGTILSQAFIAVAPIFIILFLFLIFDIFFWKNKFTQSVLNFFLKHKYYLTSATIILFSVFIIFAFLNTYLEMKWVNFEDILSSPKTSHRFNSFLAIFNANFYPLIFASLPIVVLGTFGAIASFLKARKMNNTENKLIFYFIIFILLYYFASTYNEVVSTIRYQVILYPLLLIISALGFYRIIHYLKFKYAFEIISLLLLFIGIFTLYTIKPHYLGYASFLLPKNHIVDVKDMGDGSYEAAQYLNNLPDAENLFVWTDKNGVCAFFVGKCDSFYDSNSFLNRDIDYFVLSSGRENKILTVTGSKEKIPYDFQKLYASPESVFSLFIGGRRDNYVKVMPADKFKK